MEIKGKVPSYKFAFSVKLSTLFYHFKLTFCRKRSRNAPHPEYLIELFGNRTQLNPIEFNRTIGLDCVRKSNQKICVRVRLGSIFELNRTQSNLVKITVPGTVIAFTTLALAFSYSRNTIGSGTRPEKHPLMQ